MMQGWMRRLFKNFSALPRIQLINPARALCAIFDHADFLFEANHEGCRAVAYLENGTCKYRRRATLPLHVAQRECQSERSGVPSHREASRAGL